jgi:hypothetical protein
MDRDQIRRSGGQGRVCKHVARLRPCAQQPSAGTYDGMKCTHDRTYVCRGHEHIAAYQLHDLLHNLRGPLLKLEAVRNSLSPIDGTWLSHLPRLLMFPGDLPGDLISLSGSPSSDLASAHCSASSYLTSCTNTSLQIRDTNNCLVPTYHNHKRTITSPAKTGRIRCCINRTCSAIAAHPPSRQKACD